MLGVDKFLSKVTGEMDAEQKDRMVKCTAIRFMRKVQLGTTVKLQKADVKQIIEFGG